MLNPHVEIQPLVSSKVHLLQVVEICEITELTPLADSICLRYWGSFSNISHQMRHFSDKFSLDFQHRKHRFEIQSSVLCMIITAFVDHTCEITEFFSCLQIQFDNKNEY